MATRVGLRCQINSAVSNSCLQVGSGCNVCRYGTFYDYLLTEFNDFSCSNKPNISMTTSNNLSNSVLGFFKELSGAASIPSVSYQLDYDMCSLSLVFFEY